MKGYKTLWLPGTDHAGIATQNVVEKELKKEGKTRFDLGKEKFLERVWEWKRKYGNVILKQLKRLGASCDWKKTRFTMDKDYSLAVKEAFAHLWNQGWVFLGKRIVNFLIKMKIPFVLIVRPEDKIENEVVIALLKKGFPIIFGDAMVAETLEKANIKNACAIIIAINNDMINPIIAQKAKKLNPKIRTVVRIFDDSLAEVLRKSPYIDEVISTTDTAYRFFVFGACFDVAPEERLITFNVNKKLAGVKIDNLEKLGIEIVALKRNGKWIKPKSETTLKQGDKIVVVGDIESLSNFMKKFLMS